MSLVEHSRSSTRHDDRLKLAKEIGSVDGPTTMVPQA
jgi:hypothetical protein